MKKFIKYKNKYWFVGKIIGLVIFVSLILTKILVAHAVAPAAPSDFVANATSQSQIKLTWTDNSTNETGFKLNKGTSATGPWTPLTIGANTTSYTSSSLNPNTTYYYQLCTLNGTEESAWVTANATTWPPPPTAPSGAYATAVSPSQINLTWVDNSNNETGFDVERGPSSTGPWTTFTQPANTTAFQDTGLASSTRYVYRVRAFYVFNTNTNYSAYCSMVAATTLSGPPTAPSNLTATAISQTEINVSWTNNAPVVDWFVVTRMTSGLPDSKKWIPAPDTSFTDVRLTASTTYTYTICATNSKGETCSPETASATTWSGNEIDIYKEGPESVERGTSITYKFSVYNRKDYPINNITFKDELPRPLIFAQSDIEVSVDGQIITSTFNLAAYEAKYFEITADVDKTLLAPSNLTGNVSEDKTAIQLNWTNNSNAIGMVVERSNKDNNVGFLLSSSTQSYLDQNLSPYSEYHYKVYPIKNFETIESGVLNLYIDRVQYYSLRLNWQDNANNEDKFLLERSTNSDFSPDTTTNLLLPPNTQKYDDFSLTPGTAYWYRLSAIVIGRNNPSISATYKTGVGSTDITFLPAPTLTCDHTDPTAEEPKDLFKCSWTDTSPYKDINILEYGSDINFNDPLIRIYDKDSQSNERDPLILTMGSTYYFRVRTQSYYYNILSEWSNIFVINYLDYSLAPVITSVEYNQSENYTLIRWNDATPFDVQYMVCIGAPSDGRCVHRINNVKYVQILYNDAPKGSIFYVKGFVRHFYTLDGKQYLNFSHTHFSEPYSI
jgi:hypothetical protein